MEFRRVLFRSYLASVRYQRRMLVDPWFYAIAVPAVILLGLSKRGFAAVGRISLPLIALVIPPVQAAAVVLPILIVQDLVGVRQDAVTGTTASVRVHLGGHR